MKSTILKIFFLVSVIALPALAFAAWRDAPAGPPNYDELTPGSHQADYKPMNLGSADQTKTGGVSLATDAAAKVGIGDIPGNAKLAVSNPNVTGDAVAAYSNSANSAVYAEQAGSGYAIYSSGGMNYFSGNVGIGTVGPFGNNKLAVNGGAFAVSPGVGSGNFVVDWPNGLGSARIRMWDQYGTQGVYIASDGNSFFNGGNVGIGTPAPGYKLDVQGGQVNASGGLCIAGICKTSWADVVSGTGDNLGNHTATTNIRLNDFWLSNDGDNEGIKINNSGNVGIGTTAISGKFHVVGGNSGGPGNGNQVVRFEDAVGSGLAIDMGGVNNNYGWIRAQTVGVGEKNLALQPLGGNVGIGMTDPAGYRLNVNGTVNATTLLQGGTGVCLSTGANCLAAPTPTLQQVTTAGATTNVATTFSGGANFPGSGVWNTSGNVGIGTTNPGSYKLNVNGNTLLSNTTYFGSVGYIGTGGGTLSLSVIDDSTPLLLKGPISDGYIYINTSGNVGIGTTNPLSKLSVGGDGSSIAGIYGRYTGFNLINMGVYGEGVYGVYGSSLGGPGGAGVYGSPGSGTYAGYFNGLVVVEGDLQIGNTLKASGPVEIRNSFIHNHGTFGDGQVYCSTLMINSGATFMCNNPKVQTVAFNREIRYAGTTTPEAACLALGGSGMSSVTLGTSATPAWMTALWNVTNWSQMSSSGVYPVVSLVCDY